MKHLSELTQTELGDLARVVLDETGIRLVPPDTIPPEPFCDFFRLIGPRAGGMVHGMTTTEAAMQKAREIAKEVAF